MLQQLEFIFKWAGGLLTAVALYWLTEGIRNTYFSTDSFMLTKINNSTLYLIKIKEWVNLPKT